MNLPQINPQYKLLVGIAAAASGLAIAATAAPWEPVRIVGTTMITGIAYGILNDLIACRQCIQYFTVGHVYGGNFLFSTFNPNWNALAWGAISTWWAAAIAGVSFALSARMPFPWLVHKVSRAQLVPYLLKGAGLAFGVSHINSYLARREKENTLLHPGDPPPSIPLKIQSAWAGCKTLNETGYLTLGLLGVALTVGIIAARAGLYVL